ncbi:MAG: putative transcriptional regulator [Verrucomicrobiales bacterium]|nr:putative transcriptional regulator [Verrucomicrobiales bacterium]
MNSEIQSRLRGRLAQSEDPWVERKESFNEREVRKTIVAFANSTLEGETAILFLGARNDGKHPGVRDADDVQKKVSGVAAKTYPTVQIQMCVIPVNVAGEPKEVLGVMVPHSTGRPHFAGTAYIREGSQSLAAPRQVFEELIASRNDKARRILQYKNKPVLLQVRSDSGFVLPITGIIDECDAHSVRVCEKPGMGYLWSFAISQCEIHRDPFHALIITAKSQETEEEHIRLMVRRWRELNSGRHWHSKDMNPNDPLALQFLANPLTCISAVASQADRSDSPAIQYLLALMRLEVKKVQDPKTQCQKLDHIRWKNAEMLRTVKDQDLICRKQVEIIVEVATSVMEAQNLLSQIHDTLPRNLWEAQATLLLIQLGFPQTAQPTRG